MKWLITGGEGLLSRALVRLARESGEEVLAPDREQLDVTNEASVRQCFQAYVPDIVVQGAGYTQVDRAESEEALAVRLNAHGARIVARACQKLGCVFVYPSTDYVFDGESSRPYRPDDEQRPINAYGRSKRLGELAAAEAGRALIVRTSWLYGEGRPNFVETVAHLAKGGTPLEVVNDQIGRPTWSVSLATTIRSLLKVEALGTFHASDGGKPISWADFAREIIARLPVRAEVRSVGSAELARPAARPRNSLLDLTDTERVIGRPISLWPDSLDVYLRERELRLADAATAIRSQS